MYEHIHVLLTDISLDTVGSEMTAAIEQFSYTHIHFITVPAHRRETSASHCHLTFWESCYYECRCNPKPLGFLCFFFLQQTVNLNAVQPQAMLYYWKTSLSLLCYHKKYPSLHLHQPQAYMRIFKGLFMEYKLEGEQQNHALSHISNTRRSIYRLSIHFICVHHQPGLHPFASRQQPVVSNLTSCALH